MHLVVGNMANLSEVNWVDDLVKSIFFVSVEVLGLAAVAYQRELEADSTNLDWRDSLTGVMEKERVIRACFFNKPMHSSEDVLLRRLAHWVLLIVCKNDHILPFVAKILDEIARHVSDIVNATSELSALSEVVDADQERFTPTRTLRVLKGVILRGAISEMLGRLRGRWRSLMVPVNV